MYLTVASGYPYSGADTCSHFFMSSLLKYSSALPSSTLLIARIINLLGSWYTFAPSSRSSRSWRASYFDEVSQMRVLALSKSLKAVVSSLNVESRSKICVRLDVLRLGPPISCLEYTGIVFVSIRVSFAVTSGIVVGVSRPVAIQSLEVIGACI